MLCRVCREGIEGIWDPSGTKRLGHLTDFPEILEIQVGGPKGLDKVPLLKVEGHIFGHHTSYDSLLQSKKQGCVACAMLVNCDENDVNPTFADLGYYSVFTVCLQRCDMYHLPQIMVYVGDPLEEVPHELVAHDRDDFINSALSSSTGSPETWALVEGWLDTCVTKHEACRARARAMQFTPEDGSSPSPPFLPTRLLELQTPPPLPIPAHLRSLKRPKPASSFRLVDRTQYPENVKYVTLSHCWGPGPAHLKLRLTKATDSKLRNGMPVSILPRTFREAFEIVSRLGMRYLWIDRLCIVQDSAADWAAEAGTMQGVYRGGFLNIAALGGSGDEDGCFTVRDLGLVKPGILNLSPKGKPPSLYRHPDEENEGWKSTFASDPLISRAWVLQERLLAARNLYFGRNQVFWECCANTCCETMPTGPLVRARVPTGESLANSNGEKAAKGDLFAWKTLIDVRDGGGEAQGNRLNSLLNEWSGIVSIYSTCGLTFTADKLIAVSGLAEDMRSKLQALGRDKGDYVAGLWRVALPNCLLWTVKGPSERPTPYRAPSWSWASVNGTISLPGLENRESLVSFVGVEIINKGESLTGQVIGGSITLKGPLCVAKDIRPSKMVSSVYNSYKARHLRHPHTSKPYDLQFHDIDIQFDSSHDQYDEVTILPFWLWGSSSPPRESIQGLALVKSGESRSSYSRVGYVSISVYLDSDEGMVGSCARLLKQCPIKTIEIV